MATTHIVTRERLVAEVSAQQRSHEAAGLSTTLSLPARLFLHAVSHRMNGNTLLATLPETDHEFADPARAPAQRLASWLDAGAPGLADVELECGWPGRATPILPGPAPRITPWSYAQLSAQLTWMIRDSHSCYQVTIADPEPLVEAFIAAELGEVRSFHWSCGSVDPESLSTRMRYFDGILDDGCYFWTNGHRLRVLFTNGGD
jgi:hypothetical protein